MTISTLLSSTHAPYPGILSIESPAGTAAVEPMKEKDTNVKVYSELVSGYLATNAVKKLGFTPRPGLEAEVIDGRVVLHSVVPDGFAIVDNEVFEGKKIIATRNFKRGDILYTASAALLDLHAEQGDHKYKLHIYDCKGRLLESNDNSDTHSVDDYAESSKSGTTSRRQVYGWDSYMNHSCEANAHFPLTGRTPTEIQYRAIALEDIYVGTEITCDYALFDYDCNGHSIDVCACGARRCRGQMHGFQALDLEEKVRVLHLCEEEIKDRFFATENIAVFRGSLPQGISIVTTDDGSKSLVATRSFEADEVVFKNHALIVPKADFESGKKHLLLLDGKYHLLDNEHHFIHRSSYAEMLGFDSFMDHSCSPNTAQVYLDGENYVVRATKKIEIGGKITCDYMALDNEAAGVGNYGTTSFRCNCGEANCRGELVC